MNKNPEVEKAKKRMDRIKYKMLLQTDPGWMEYLGVPRWGCYYKDCLAIPQVLTGKIFNMDEHMFLYDNSMQTHLLIIEKVERLTRMPFVRIKPKIPDTEKFITAALRYVHWNGRAVHIGNRTEYLNYATPHRTDFTLVRQISVERNRDGTFREKGHHYVLGNENGTPIWNSHPGLDTEEDVHFIRIRIDGGRE